MQRFFVTEATIFAQLASEFRFPHRQSASEEICDFRYEKSVLQLVSDRFFRPYLLIP